MKKLRPSAGIIIICAIFLVTGVLALHDLSLYNPDSTRYLVWAKSLAGYHGFEGFRDYTSPEGEQYVIHAPLYAIVLAPISFLFGGSIIALKIWTLLFGIAAIFFMFKWVRDTYSTTAALAASILLAANSLFWLFSTEILSDVPFLAFMIFFFVLCDRLGGDRLGGDRLGGDRLGGDKLVGDKFGGDKLGEGNASKPASTMSLALLGVILAVCLTMREIGIALVLAAAVYALWKKDWRRLALSLEIPGAVYLLWWFRNEYIVGGREIPALTNGKMFAKRYYTLDADPFVKEILARAGANFSVYFHRLGETLLFPMYNDYSNDVVYRLAPMHVTMFSAVRAIAPLLVAVTAIGVVAGLYRDFKSSKTFGLKILFLVFYFAILLCYPINDVRFLLPLLAFLVYFFAAGLGWALEFAKARSNHPLTPSFGRRGNFAAGDAGQDGTVANAPAQGGQVSGVLPSRKERARNDFQWKHSITSYAVFAVVLVFSVPNLFWNAECISAVNSYHRFFPADASDSTRSPEDVLRAGSLFGKPFSLAGAWIAQHSPPGIVMLSQMKDIAYWVGDRKVLNVNETISVTDFDDYLRDYNVTFLVAGRFVNGLREFEYQMDVSPRYSFDLVYTIGALDIYHVVRHQKGWRENVPPDTSTPFLHGLACLQRRDYDGARALFEQVRRVDTLNYAALFFVGVADEFAGDPDAALNNFGKFQFLPQAGMYLDAAQIHETYVRARTQADVSADLDSRSEILLKLAGAYWQQGFHAQANDLIAQIFKADSSNLGAYAFGVYFALDEGETAKARTFLGAAQRHFGQENIVREYSHYFDVADSLREGLDTLHRQEQLDALGAVFLEIGVVHASEDILLQVVELYPADREAPKMLDEMYEFERRFAPAARVLQLHLAVDPNDAEAKNALEVLERRVGG